MNWKTVTLASAIALSVLPAPRARADVLYTVSNPAQNFTLFTYDSPTFITTDTTILPAQLAFLNPAAATTTSIEFIPQSLTHPGTSELAIGNPTPTLAAEFRYFPPGTFTQFGVTKGDANSFGYPNSQLTVATPEPASAAVLGVACLGMVAVRRWTDPRKRSREGRSA